MSVPVGITMSLGWLRRHASVRGIVMTVLALIVAGLAIATLCYQPRPIVDVSSIPATTTAPAVDVAAPVVPPLGVFHVECVMAPTDLPWLPHAMIFDPTQRPGA